MLSGSEWQAPAAVEIAIRATVFALFTIGALILFIWARRAWRGRYFGRRDARTVGIRNDWARIVSLAVSPMTWINKPMDRQLIESMLLDEIDVADGNALPALVRCLRESGLLERYIYEARTSRGWKRQHALAKLGRTRAVESIPALSEALDSRNPGVVTVALRALGNLEMPRAMRPVLDQLAEGMLVLPNVPLKHALVHGCRSMPSMIVEYMDRVPAATRDLLAQSLGQIATPEMADDLALLAGDPSPEVRAAAARALGRCGREFAIGLLFTLILDEVWFVRLRAVISLGELKDAGTIDSLVKSLCDSHRIVRQRAAMALVSFETHAGDVMEKVISTGDKFALHSFVSELQRSGCYPAVIEKLRKRGLDPINSGLIAAAEGARKELQFSIPEAKE